MGKNIIELSITTTVEGTFFEITVPDGIGGYISRRISYQVLKDAINEEILFNKGYYEDESALVAAYPAGQAGWYAINGDTDTVWLWDDGSSAWVDSGTSGSVTSVNSLTGAVVLNAVNIPFTSLGGLASTNTRDAIDEVQANVDAIVSGESKIITDTFDNTDLSSYILSINHSKETQVIDMIVYDDNGVLQDISGMFSIIDNNNVQIDFGYDISGTWTYILKYWNLS